MAVFNLAASASNAFGGKLYDLLRGGLAPYPALAALTLIGALGTLACWFFLPFIRASADEAPAAALAGTLRDN